MLFHALLSAFRIASWEGNESLLTTLITEDGIEHDVNWKQLQALTLNAAIAHYGVESAEDLRPHMKVYRTSQTPVIGPSTYEELTRSERKPMD